MELKGYDKSRIFVSERSGSFLVYDRETGNLHHVRDKGKIDEAISQIMLIPERGSAFVKTDENVFKLNMSTTCNLNCDYCFRDKKSHIQTDVAKARKIIDYIVDVYSPHVWMYSFSVNLTSESLVELNKIKEIKRYIDERTSPTYTVKDFKDLTDARNHLACFPKSLVKNPEDYKDVESVVELLNSILSMKNMVSFFPLPDGMSLPAWEAERFRNLKNLSGYSLMEFNLRFLECLFPETFLRKPHYAFYICTNGTVYNDDVVDFFREIKLDTICISLDGPSGVHNRHRFFNDNSASHELILENIRKFKAAGLKVSVSAVLTSDFPFPLQLAEYFKELKVDSMDFNAVRAGSRASFDENSIDKLIQGYKELFEHIYCDVLNGDFSLIDLLKDDAVFAGIKLLIGKNRIVKRCKWNEDTIFDSDGDIYPCDYFIGNRKYLRGNISSPEVKDVCNGKLFVDERGNCKDCWCKYLCGGTCFYNSLKNMDDISVPDTVECKLNKAMKEMSVQFVHKLIDSGVDLFEFAKRIGFGIDESILFNESYFVKKGIACSVKGTLTKIELELNGIMEWLTEKNVSFDKQLYISILNIEETRSNKLLDAIAIIPIDYKAQIKKLPDFFSENCKLVENNSFGRVISAKTLSKDNYVDKTKEHIHQLIESFRIPVQGYYWYKGTLQAFLGYRNEEISVFMQRAEGVY